MTNLRVFVKHQSPAPRVDVVKVTKTMRRVTVPMQGQSTSMLILVSDQPPIANANPEH